MVFFGVIYKITCTINGSVYIGQTTRSIEIRFKEHLRDSKKNLNWSLYNAIRKYGFENFIIEEIDGANSKSELNYREIHWINQYKSNKLGYNIRIGGSFKEIGEESKIKMSISQLKMRKKPFKVYEIKEDNTFKFIGKWDNITVCSRELNLSINGIYSALYLSGKQRYKNYKMISCIKKPFFNRVVKNE
jgi:hypothetical protein